MNPEQAKSSARWFVATFGGAAAGWFAAKGWFTIDQVTSVLNSETTISILASAAVFIWGLFTHTQKNAVAVVSMIATGPANDRAVSAQTALIEGTKAVALDTSIPKSEEAKNTLVAATIALPEVKTIVTDAKTADASPSPSVIAASDLRKVGT
jgi:hypothetical protein